MDMFIGNCIRMLKKNVGGADKVIRIIIGIVAMLAGLYFKSWWGLLGLVIFLTGVVGRCGLYYLIGVNTCPVKEGNSDVVSKSSQSGM
jgi:hypothetical protein